MGVVQGLLCAVAAQWAAPFMPPAAPNHVWHRVPSIQISCPTGTAIPAGRRRQPANSRSFSTQQRVGHILVPETPEHSAGDKVAGETTAESMDGMEQQAAEESMEQSARKRNA